MENNQKKQNLKMIENRFIIDLNDKLGTGSFGDVFRAYDKKDPQSQICVKIIKIEKYQNNKGVLKLINREVKTLRLLSQNECPYIVKLINDCMSSKNIYMFLEYCNQGDLQTHIGQRQYITETEVIIFLQQIIKAFLVLNENKVIHRDLKPANIMINNKQIKITDFGFSRILQNIETKTKITQLGTPYYMSPELINDDESIDGKCDVWSLGIIIYQLLYGQHPFNGNNLKELNQSIQHQQLEFPDKPTRSNKIKSLIKQMLQKDQDQRVSWRQLAENEIFVCDLKNMHNNEIIINNNGNNENTSNNLDKIYNPNDTINQTQLIEEGSDNQMEIYQLCLQERQKVENNQLKMQKIDQYFMTHREVYVFTDKLINRIINSYSQGILKLSQDKYRQLYAILLKFQQQIIKNLQESLQNEIMINDFEPDDLRRFYKTQLFLTFKNQVNQDWLNCCNNLQKISLELQDQINILNEDLNNNLQDTMKYIILICLEDLSGYLQIQQQNQENKENLIIIRYLIIFFDMNVQIQNLQFLNQENFFQFQDEIENQKSESDIIIEITNLADKNLILKYTLKL